MMLAHVTDAALAGYCRQAYYHPELVRAAQPELAAALDCRGTHGCRRCGRTVRVDVQAQVYRDAAGHHLLVFRGSDRPADWLANLDLRPCHHYGLGLQAGFLHGVEAMQERLLAVLERPTGFTVTGHSKGGAEALIAGYDLHLRHGGRVPVTVVTFGAPRVGGRRYALALGHALTLRRYVHGADPVPGLPPAWLGYRHACPPRRLGAGWPSLSWRLLAPVAGRLRRDHPIAAYHHALSEDCS